MQRSEEAARRFIATNRKPDTRHLDGRGFEGDFWSFIPLKKKECQNEEHSRLISFLVS
jgi:hypothetical protein